MFLFFQIFYWKEARDFAVACLLLTVQSKILSFLYDFEQLAVVMISYKIRNALRIDPTITKQIHAYKESDSLHTMCVGRGRTE
jgi:hypothetical protein